MPTLAAGKTLFQSPTGKTAFLVSSLKGPGTSLSAADEKSDAGAFQLRDVPGTLSTEQVVESAVVSEDGGSVTLSGFLYYGNYFLHARDSSSFATQSHGGAQNSDDGIGNKDVRGGRHMGSIRSDGEYQEEGGEVDRSVDAGAGMAREVAKARSNSRESGEVGGFSTAPPVSPPSPRPQVRRSWFKFTISAVPVPPAQTATASPTAPTSAASNQTTTTTTAAATATTSSSATATSPTSTGPTAVRISASVNPSTSDRTYILLKSTPKERIFGTGEAFSSFDLKGAVVPIISREVSIEINKQKIRNKNLGISSRACVVLIGLVTTTCSASS